MTIPAGTYEGVDEDVRTVGTVGSIFCTADLPEDVVYDFLKTIYENWDALKAINPTAFGDLDVNDWLNGATAPIHPGAEKFYKEMGVMYTHSSLGRGDPLLTACTVRRGSPPQSLLGRVQANTPGSDST